MSGSTAVLPDIGALRDLRAFVGRAHRADPEGSARLVGHGAVLAVYVSPLHGAGGPTVLGLRTTALLRPSRADVTVVLGALESACEQELERRGAPRPGDHPGREADPATGVHLALPPGDGAHVSWAGVTPPRSGWEILGQVGADLLARAAAEGEREVAGRTAAGQPSQELHRVRARVWGRALAEEPAGLPAGIAFAAHVLGFIVEGERGTVHRTGAWSRLTTSRGHVLARTGLML